MTLAPTPGQTVGPFFRFGLEFERSEELVDRSHPGAVRLHGTVYDGAGVPVPDAIVEIWQADEHGVIPSESGSLHRDGYTFTGFGRAMTDDTGRYGFTTVNPGGGGSPFIAVAVFARGLMNKLHTRIYLPESEPDALLTELGPARAATIVAQREPDGALRHDIRLQGDGETVFFAYR